MPIPSPFHERTAALCHSYKWKDWAGYYAVCSFDSSHDSEYFAFRHGAGLIDVTPLYKYEVTGPDAARFLSRATVRDIGKLKPGRVTYLCWLDDDGKVVDDGTVANITGMDKGADTTPRFRLTAAEPSLSWLARLTAGYDVTLVDSTAQLATLALQGPNARAILLACGAAVTEKLKFFGVARAQVAAPGKTAAPIDVWITRTGYTGDLGYEIWADAKDAMGLYDTLMQVGANYGMLPAGLDALDVTRVEAGFIMNGVDYFSSHHCLIEERKSSPYELGLAWTVELDRADGTVFVGQAALREELKRGSEYQLVGLDVDWLETEALFGDYGLPPEICSKAWRDGRPVYDQAGHWVGMATSGAWSPILKRNLALGQVRTPFAREGAQLKIELTVEYRRHTVTATVVKTPFYNPPRKRS